MGLELHNSDGQTPLNEEEKEGLLNRSISTRGELDEFEQQNIEQAIQWTLSRKFKEEYVFSEGFICEVHKRMFGNVWAWAGDYRKSNKNIGVDKWQIPIELKSMLEDAKYWHNNKTYSQDEIAIRFKHRLVSIHCFPNGNGRHSRLIADIIIEKLYNKPVFSWGATKHSDDDDSRTAYLKAIKLADKNDYTLLLAFARS